MTGEFYNGPGVYRISNEDYHAGPGISKSGLHTLYKRTPRHFRFGERTTTKAFDLGDGVHAAILEPERFEREFVCGPADRRGNKWNDLLALCTADGQTLLTSGDHAEACRIRDAAWKNPDVRWLLTGSLTVEPSGFWIDEETGLTVRCRPDAANADHRFIVDLKTAVDADPWKFAKACDDFGYPMQEAIYTHGWERACDAELERGTLLGQKAAKVEGFCFITMEKKAPWETVVYELKPSAVAEGWAEYRKALAVYAACRAYEDIIAAADMPDIERAARLREAWPGYTAGIQEIDIPAYAYRLTTRAPD